jgi:hypothetical protein
MAGAEYGPDEATTLVNVQDGAQNVVSDSISGNVDATHTLDGVVSEVATNTQQMDVAKAAVDEKYRLEQVVTYKFQQGYPEFMKTLKDMSANQLRRAWAASMIHPLADKPTRWSYPIEEKAFRLGTGLDECKFSMLLLGIDRYPELVKAQAKAESEAANGTSLESSHLQSEEQQGGTSLSSDEQPGNSSEAT